MRSGRPLNIMVGIFLKVLYAGLPLGCAGAALYDVMLHGFGSVLLQVGFSIAALFLGVHLIRRTIVFADDMLWATAPARTAAAFRIATVRRRLVELLAARPVLSEA